MPLSGEGGETKEGRGELGLTFVPNGILIHPLFGHNRPGPKNWGCCVPIGGRAGAQLNINKTFSSRPRPRLEVSRPSRAGLELPRDQNKTQGQQP